MGLKDMTKSRINSDVSTIVYKNELSTLEKIIEKCPGEDIETPGVGFTNKWVRTYMDDSKRFRIDYQMHKSSEEDKNEVVADPIQLEYDMGDDVSVIILKSEGNISYLLSSPETGMLLLATVSERQLSLFNGTGYITSSRFYKENGEQKITLENVINPELKREETILRDIIYNRLKEQPELSEYTERIMSGFDKILSLDPDREITFLTEEQIARVEVLKKTVKLEKANATLEEENTTLKEQNTALEKENAKLKEQNTALEGENTKLKEYDKRNKKMLRIALKFVEHIEKSVLGKFLYRENLKEFYKQVDEDTVTNKNDER